MQEPFASEEKITIRTATRHFPLRPDGSPIPIGSVWKWTVPDRTSPILEAVMIGGRLYTSVGAIHRFIAATNERRMNPRHRRKADRPRPPSLLDCEAEKVGKVLEKLGV